MGVRRGLNITHASPWGVNPTNAQTPFYIRRFLCEDNNGMLSRAVGGILSQIKRSQMLLLTKLSGFVQTTSTNFSNQVTSTRLHAALSIVTTKDNGQELK